MANLITLSILSPDKNVYSGAVKKIFVTSEYGRLEILPNHADMITLLIPSITEIIDENNNTKRLFTSYGVLEINKNNVSINCDAGELPEKIDYKRAEEAKERAEKRLEQKEGIDVKRAEAALLRAITRLKLREI